MGFKIGDTVSVNATYPEPTGWSRIGDIVGFELDWVDVLIEGERMPSYFLESELDLYLSNTSESVIVEDVVNHPSHYTSHPSGIEAIEVTRHYGFAIGSAMKYLWRNGLKRDPDKTSKEKQIEDLKKAVWYIEDEIARLYD